MWQAVEVGDEDAVKCLLDNGQVDFDSKDAEGKTPLSLAVRGGDYRIVTLILGHKKIDINSEDEKGRTALSWAVKTGNEAIVKLLLDTDDIDFEVKSQDSRTLLSVAVEEGYEDIALLLLDYCKVEIDSTLSWWPRSGRWSSALHGAASSGMLSLVDPLLGRGCDVNIRDWWGFTPLHNAAASGQVKMMAVLLEHGAEINAQNMLGRTPLHLAVWESRQIQGVDLLLRHGAKVNLQDQSGLTPYDMFLDMHPSYARSTRPCHVETDYAIGDMLLNCHYERASAQPMDMTVDPCQRADDGGLDQSDRSFEVEIPAGWVPGTMGLCVKMFAGWLASIIQQTSSGVAEYALPGILDEFGIRLSQEGNSEEHRGTVWFVHTSNAYELVSHIFQKC